MTGRWSGAARTSRRFAVPALALTAGLLFAAEAPLFNADGLRSTRYRAPTPATVPHGTVLDTAGLVRLLAEADPVLIDVQAVVVRPELAEFGLSWLPSRPRLHIPGSTWLPNVGYGTLAPRMETYFRDNLARLTGGDRDRPVVIYCVIDCWMSWNAVQRAAGYGYCRLYWYRDGTDGWAEQGLPLVEAEPRPLKP
ncbi:MAG: PQQ-dependent catabolism-associated CXXCW motif protein [Candidatus Competibacterales bacterium]|nr:PQQ-dependent catabolism-associated CXXCW motif protein [Candidatus Competibacterales bacterium]